jgi:hypothetical protein
MSASFVMNGEFNPSVLVLSPFGQSVLAHLYDWADSLCALLVLGLCGLACSLPAVGWADHTAFRSF